MAFSMDFRRPRPKIEIDLVNQKPNLVNSYTTGDRIDGTVTITVDHDIRFDDIHITFDGTSRTSVERGSVPGQSGAYQTFLKLRQPIDHYPSPRILQAGRTYKFPFTFVVPDRLLPQACSHSKSNGHLERTHTLLPPSLGDPMLTVRNGKSHLLNDLSPDMCRIAYLVRVSVLRRDGGKDKGNKRKSLASAGKKVRIIPAIYEEPPINIPNHEEDGYCTRKEKDIRRGWTRAKRGRLVVAASQPKPIEVHPENNRNNDSESVSSVATLNLRFDPADEHEQPPSLGNVGTKLTASTFFGAHPWTDFPVASRAGQWAQTGRGIYIENVPLSTRCVKSVPWTKHSSVDDEALSHRNSMKFTSSTEPQIGPSTSFRSSTTPYYYTASVVIPINLPTTKTLVPTFHSCLISRTYSLDLNVSYHPANTSLLDPAISLRIPIQVTSPLRYDKISPKDDDLGLAISSDEVEAEFFTPRSVTRLVSRETVAPPPAYGGYQPRGSGSLGERSVRTVIA